MIEVISLYTIDDNKLVLTNRQETVSVPVSAFEAEFKPWPQGQLSMQLDWDKIKELRFER